MFHSQTGPEHPPAKANASEIINPIINPNEPTQKPPTHVVDGAGGVGELTFRKVEKVDNERVWYVAYVAPRSEKKVCKDIADMPIEAYTPTRMETRLWRNGRRKKVEKVLIPGVVFVKISSTQIEDVRRVPNVYSYMMDPAKRGNKQGVKTFAIIPEAEMRLLKAMVGQDEYNVDFSSQFSLGEHVRIVGFENFGETAQIVRLPGNKSTYVGVRVGFLGCAYMEVPQGRVLKMQ